jgi:hypothetical protein
MENNQYENSDYTSKITAQKMWYSARIRYYAEKKHVSWAELSILSGLSEEFVHKLWNAESIPSRAALKSIALALEVPAENFEFSSEH